MDGNPIARTGRARAWLTARSTELRERVQRIGEDLRRARELPVRDSSDAAVYQENDSILQRIADSARRELAQIERALARVAAGEFAYCESCGEEIDERRLRIVPPTTLCGCCAQRGR